MNANGNNFAIYYNQDFENCACADDEPMQQLDRALDA
jgi:hypothetical protein